MIYIYSVSQDTPNNKVGDSLEVAIRNSSIMIALSSIVVASDELKITFKGNLGTDDKDTLDSLVASHDGSNEVEETVQKTTSILPQGGKKVTYRGFQFDAAVNSETTYDHPILENFYIRDGDLEVKDYDYNDYAYMALVDKDYIHAGVLYPSEPAPGVTWEQAMPDGVVLHAYISDYPIDARSNPSVTEIPNEALSDLNLNGIYMRVKYKNNSLASVAKCKVRLRGYS